MFPQGFYYMKMLKQNLLHFLFHVTLANAHILKWARYSSVVMPPFPTSSMSGSVRQKN